MLVAAVLRPEQREHHQLEVVRLALEQFDDAVELTVCETELTVERLFRDRAQVGQFSRGPGGDWLKPDPGGTVVRSKRVGR